MKLTVAVAAYGRYRYLDEAAASIARQTRPPDEVLVFTDSREAVRPIFQKHGVEAEILQEPDLTYCATYARIGETASGDYVLPLEDDDVFKPEKLERLEPVLKEGRWTLVKHAADFIDPESKPTTWFWFQQPEEPAVVTRENAWQLYRKFHYHVWPSTFAVKTDLLRRHGEILKRMLLLADFAIFTLALRDGEVFYHPEKLTYYRIGAGHSQLVTCNDLPKVVCTWNKYTHDIDVLSSYIDIKEINKIINYLYISYLVSIYLLNNKFDCIFKYRVSHLSFVKMSFVAVAKRIYPLSRGVLFAWLSPLLGSKRAAEIYYRRWCRKLQKPAR
jgi:glycosyltransferase involved in cell wall biosynthesis